MKHIVQQNIFIYTIYNQLNNENLFKEYFQFLNRL